MWNDRGAWVWSTEETHPPLVDAEDFATAQALLGAAKSQPGSRVRSAKPGRTYALRGLVRCEACGRLLEGCWVNGTPRYRCRLTGSDYARNTALAARHGRCPSVREDRIRRGEALADRTETVEEFEHVASRDLLSRAERPEILLRLRLVRGGLRDPPADDGRIASGVERGPVAGEALVGVGDGPTRGLGPVVSP